LLVRLCTKCADYYLEGATDWGLLGWGAGRMVNEEQTTDALVSMT